MTRTAYAKAREKLLHTAFIELNEACVVETMYEDGDYETYKGLRVLAVDGSRIILPDSTEIAREFGSRRHENQMATGSYCVALASALYDVRNKVCLHALLRHISSYEGDLAAEHLAHVNEKDLVIFDRGYCTPKMMALATASGAKFMIRCRRNSLGVINKMFDTTNSDDIVVEIKDPTASDQKITVRLVRVVLNTGEIEVLATSLFDQELFSLDDLREIYWMRWGIETFYGVLKSRLELENFSGNSVESIRQDFFVAVFLTGVESILTEDVNTELAERETHHEQQVNRAVSFHAIKEGAFELFNSKAPIDQVVDDLEQLFKTNPTTKRPGRNPSRIESSLRQRFNHRKRRRKATY